MERFAVRIVKDKMKLKVVVIGFLVEFPRHFVLGQFCSDLAAAVNAECVQTLHRRAEGVN